MSFKYEINVYSKWVFYLIQYHCEVSISYTINGMLNKNIVLKCYQGLKTGERGCKNVIYEVYKNSLTISLHKLT